MQVKIQEEIKKKLNDKAYKEWIKEKKEFNIYKTPAWNPVKHKSKRPNSIHRKNAFRDGNSSKRLGGLYERQNLFWEKNEPCRPNSL